MCIVQWACHPQLDHYMLSKLLRGFKASQLWHVNTPVCWLLQLKMGWLVGNRKAAQCILSLYQDSELQHKHRGHLNAIKQLTKFQETFSPTGLLYPLEVVIVLHRYYGYSNKCIRILARALRKHRASLYIHKLQTPSGDIVLHTSKLH